MAREILLEGDHRRKIFYEKDPVTGLIGVRVNYNNDMHLAPTAERRKDTPGGFKTTKENAGMHLMAHIPDSVVLLELVPRGICRPGGSVIDYPALHKWLDLSDNKVFRVNQGENVVSISTYAELQTAGQNWLGRTSSALVPRIQEFISLAEAQIARDLRRYTKFTTITIAADQNNLPADVKELKSARLVTDSASQDLPLIVTTPEELAVRRAQTGNAPGRPLRVSLFNDSMNQILLVQPTPDGVYNCEISYLIKLVPLSATNTTNAVLLEAPDLYLFGLLKEAEPFLENDDRVPMWEAKYQKALDSLMALKDREEYEASRRPVPLERVFS